MITKREQKKIFMNFLSKTFNKKLNNNIKYYV